MGTSEFTAGGNCPCDGLASHPGGVELLLVASCYGNQDKLRPDGPLGLFSDFTLPYMYMYMYMYRKHPQISRTFFPKIVAQNRGCGLSAGTFQKGAVHFSELTLL